MDIIKALNWRYATKRMNGNKIPESKLNTILEAIWLAPTSYGMQPFSVVVIENVELLKKIQPIAYMQPQVSEASVLLVFAAWDNITQERIDEYISHVCSVRNVTEDSMKNLKVEIELKLKNTIDINHCWAANQTYISLGIAIATAALIQIDTTPIEGFISEDLDEVLKLKERGLKSVVLLALGYRDEEHDHLLGLPKVRQNKEDLFISIQSEIGFTASNINNIKSI
jgi:nitroreductase/dihydropteridine reductase